MLKIQDLTITTNKGRVLLKDFSFVLNDNDKIALIGEEGNGKSTILKIIAGIDVSSYVSHEGQIIADGRIAYLPQTLDEEDLRKDVASFISDELEYGRLYSCAAGMKVDVTPLLERKMYTLSGGERVKISLLKILYQQPDMLLLDEPTNDLDLKTLIWLEEFIRNTDLPMIFISHDETLLENCAEGILHLEQLKRKTESHITFSGTDYRTYRKYRSDFIDKNNMIARKEKAEFNKQMEKWRKIYQRVDHEQKTISRQDPHGGFLLKKKMHSVKAQGRQLEEKEKNLTKKYEPEEAIDIFFEHVDINPGKEILRLHLPELTVDEKILAENIDLTVFGNDKICIIGDNGSGKSTLIKMIAETLLQRDDINAGYMPQNYWEVMDYDISPVDYLWDGYSIREKGKIQSYLGALKFTTEEMSHAIRELSEGQKCKILMVKMILDGNDVLILDEPTRNLSPLSNPRIRQILNEYEGCIISVSHDRKYIEEVADKVYELDEDGLKLLM
ncbi:MAG: ABC-F family ATP-binding cassette domain-containing protein [Erysipelotrichaceae bacterium]|nr:ABC-F family ATP-binding cassette domain-containing protein [Erysipelotrichaceae bacterium]